jgi:hypothetical protein
MDAVSSVAQSIQSVNDLLKMTTTKAMDAAEKIMKVTVADAVGAEVGKGAAIDLIA